MGLNKKKILKKRFNVIDLIIVLLIIICIAGVCLRSISLDGLGSDETLETAQISYLVRNIRHTSNVCFIEGDDVYTYEDGIRIGKFMNNPRSLPAIDYETDNNGNTVKVVYPENTRIDVDGKILSEGKWVDGNFFVGGSMYIAPGKEIKVCTTNITVTLLVTDVSKNIES